MDLKTANDIDEKERVFFDLSQQTYNKLCMVFDSLMTNFTFKNQNPTEEDKFYMYSCLYTIATQFLKYQVEGISEIQRISREEVVANITKGMTQLYELEGIC